MLSGLLQAAEEVCCAQAMAQVKVWADGRGLGRRSSMWPRGGVLSSCGELWVCVVAVCVLREECRQ